MGASDNFQPAASGKFSQVEQEGNKTVYHLTYKYAPVTNEVQQQWKAELESKGVAFLAPLGNKTYVVSFDHQRLRDIQDLTYVGSVNLNTLDTSFCGEGNEDQVGNQHILSFWNRDYAEKAKDSIRSLNTSEGAEIIQIVGISGRKSFLIDFKRENKKAVEEFLSQLTGCKRLEPKTFPTISVNLMM